MRKILTTAFALFCFVYLVGQTPSYTLQDFYGSDYDLDVKVDSIFNTLSDQERVAQMIITSAGTNGKPDAVVQELVGKRLVGGVIYMKGGINEHKNRTEKLTKLTEVNNGLPLLLSMDAEPSLLNSRLVGSQDVPKTNWIQTEQECDSICTIINEELLYTGVRHNYAPVLDIGTKNAAIKSRSFGDDVDQVIRLNNAFIRTTQEAGIVATAKHFPGHGLVKGDTHHQSVYIDGEMLEVNNYAPIIEAGVLSVMVAHVVVKNNPEYDTEGLPASCSRKIITDLLKNEMNFKGLVITDALNMMKAVTIFDNAPLLASKAGSDLLLMPIDERGTIKSILKEMGTDANYRDQVYTSVRKILRLKVCLGMIK